MTIEQTATHLGKKSRYIYKIIHNRRIGAYLNEQQKTALKHVSELATIISAGCITRKILAQKMGVNQWRTYWKDNIQLAKKVSTKEEGSQGA
ncbi:hypothetical protein NXW34_24350, partial [Bacteroides thetaiotaomicron]|nr:hypothetical protein [Bacteroides thetaiotaomicron]